VPAGSPVPPDDRFGRLLAALPRERTQLLPALLLAQEAFGHVPNPAIERIAAHLRLTVNDVEGVVTAYPDMRRRPTGARVVRVCTGLSCATAGAERLVAVLTSTLGLVPGKTAPDGSITLEASACCFVCGVAPVVEVDGVSYGRVDEETLAALVSEESPRAPGRDLGALP
jgi:NADH:ubiquinone oxidoreductase subunit E